MSGDLRPLGIGEILGLGIALFRRHWKTLVLSVVCLVAPVQLLSALLTAWIAPEQLDLTRSNSGVTDAEVGRFLGGQLLVGVLGLVTALLATAVCLSAVSEAYVGVQPDWRRSLRAGLRRLGSLVWLTVAGAIVLFVAYLALIVPGIWLTVLWSVSVPALLLERLGPVRALGRSAELVRGRWWATAGALAVGLVLVSIIGGVVAALVLLVPSLVDKGNVPLAVVADVIGGTLGAALTTPFSSTIIALVYFDLRVRKDGLDRAQLAAAAGVAYDPDTVRRPEAPELPGGWLPPQPPLA